MSERNEIVFFTDGSVELEVPISPNEETVWLTANQMAELFTKDEKTIRRHINNVFDDEELERNNNTQKMRVVGVKQPVAFYTLDVIISVGYRVKSKRGIAFRRWANEVLKQYIIRGYAINQRRLHDMGEVIRLMKRTENDLDARQVLSVIERYNSALDLLDDYDHQTVHRPKGNIDTYVINYDECMSLIRQMKFANRSELFGNEKDDSFKASIGDIYQSFDRKDLYPTAEEKAANLLYFIVKNHSFVDGNKRIAAAVFLYFLDKNGMLISDTGEKKLRTIRS